LIELLTKDEPKLETARQGKIKTRNVSGKISGRSTNVVNVILAATSTPTTSVLETKNSELALNANHLGHIMEFTGDAT
jgi:hypothetical protein